MRGCWLKRERRDTCLLLVAGWGMGPEPFAGLTGPDRDLYLLFDHQALTLPEPGHLWEYDQVELLAWSMGVWVAATTLAPFAKRFASATALAGTLHPIDDRLGIPAAAWMEMEEQLDETMLKRFYASMFTEKKELRRFLAHRPERTLASLKNELKSLRRQVFATPVPVDLFTCRIVPRRDRIFPPRNQLRAWGKDRCQRQPWPHFPPSLLEHPAL
jgi:hypothetical protein